MLEERPLFHIHAPKTAGLSLRMIFAELCGLERVFKLGVAGGGVVNTLEDFMAGDWPGDLPAGRCGYGGNGSVKAGGTAWPKTRLYICESPPSRFGRSVSRWRGNV